MPVGTLRRWLDDQGGATLVQFIAVLPAFVLVVIGAYAMFKVMASRDTLCESAWEASRYLQVEGPHFPEDGVGEGGEDLSYPDGWRNIAVDIMNQELASRTMVELYPIEESNVELWPPDKPTSPESTIRDGRAVLDENLFYLQVTKPITNPLGMLFDLPNADPGMINLTCRIGGFYEGPPVEPTLLRPPNNAGPGCDPPRQDCPVNPGYTDTPVPRDGTPTVCPICNPR